MCTSVVNQLYQSNSQFNGVLVKLSSVYVNTEALSHGIRNNPSPVPVNMAT